MKRDKCTTMHSFGGGFVVCVFLFLSKQTNQILSFTQYLELKIPKTTWGLLLCCFLATPNFPTNFNCWCWMVNQYLTSILCHFACHILRFHLFHSFYLWLTSSLLKMSCPLQTWIISHLAFWYFSDASFYSAKLAYSSCLLDLLFILPLLWIFNCPHMPEFPALFHILPQCSM